MTRCSRNVYVNGSLLTNGASPATSTVNVTVLSVTPARAGRLFALASVEIEIGGVAIELHGIHALRVEPAGTRIELPQFRDVSGLFSSVVTLPAEIDLWPNRRCRARRPGRPRLSKATVRRCVSGDRILDAAELGAGMTLADIGAGDRLIAFYAIASRVVVAGEQAASWVRPKSVFSQAYRFQ